MTNRSTYYYSATFLGMPSVFIINVKVVFRILVMPDSAGASSTDTGRVATSRIPMCDILQCDFCILFIFSQKYLKPSIN